MLVEHIAREQITVSNAVKTLTAATITAEMVYADIQVQAQQIRVTFDGATAPVAATTGTLWNPGSTYRVWGQTNMEALKMIRESADATVVVNYWGRGT